MGTTNTSKGKGKGKGKGAKGIVKGKPVKGFAPRLTHANGADFNPKRPGVIASIVNMLATGGGMTKKDMLAQLVAQFPERGEGQMKSTLSMQVPSGIYHEKGYDVTSTPSEGGTLYSLTLAAIKAGDEWRNHPEGGMNGTLPRPERKGDSE